MGVGYPHTSLGARGPRLWACGPPGHPRSWGLDRRQPFPHTQPSAEVLGSMTQLGRVCTWPVSPFSPARASVSWATPLPSPGPPAACPEEGSPGQVTQKAPVSQGLGASRLLCMEGREPWPFLLRSESHCRVDQGPCGPAAGPRPGGGWLRIRACRAAPPFREPAAQYGPTTWGDGPTRRQAANNLFSPELPKAITVYQKLAQQPRRLPSPRRAPISP